ncbi:MAG: extracellular solute-binding protein [Spirochaetia bacterium]|nr:extracellular solute-binding protein [Spirochaetia bacterium]
MIQNLRQISFIIKSCLLMTMFLLFSSGYNTYSAISAPEAAKTNGEIALTIDFNGVKTSYTHETLFNEQFSLSIPSEIVEPTNSSENLFTAAALADFLPLILDLWEFTVSDTSGNVYNLLQSWSADFLFETYLYLTENGISLVHRTMSVNQIETITLKGDKLAEKPLDVWLSWEGTNQLKQIIADFARKYGVKIETNVIPGIDTKLAAHHRGNMKIPDVVMIQSDYLPKLIAEQALQPVVWKLSDVYQPRGVEAFTSTQLYAVPFYSDVQIICWNPEIIDHPYGNTDNDVSGTLEMMENNLAAVPASYTPAVWNIYSAYWLLPFQMGFGKSAILESDGSITVNDRATIDALTYLIHLLDTGLIGAVERDGMISQFIQGEVGMILTGSYALPGFIDLGIPFNVAAYPVNQDNGAYVSPLIDYKGFSIPKKSRNPIAARRLIQYLTSPQVQAAFSFNNFKNPSRNDIWDLSTIPDQISRVLQISISQGSVIPPEAAYKISKDTMWKIIRLILAKQLTPVDGLNKAQEIIDNQLKRLR